MWREKVKQVRLTGTIYKKPLALCEPTVKKIKVFQQEKKSKDLEEELEATLNFLMQTIIFTTTPKPHVILISKEEEEEEKEINPNLLLRNNHNKLLNQILWRQKLSCKNS